MEVEDPLALLDTDAAIAPLLEAAKDSLSNKSTIRALAMKVLSDPDIFCGFDELKATIVGAAGLEDDPQLLATLDLFSYGVYNDYVQNPGQFLQLNETQLTKLQHLTLLTYIQQAAHEGRSTLAYSTISAALQVNDQRAMEQVILNGLYRRTLNGRLSQREKRLILTSVPICISRDVALTTLPNILTQLQALKDRLDTSHAGLGKTNVSVNKTLDELSNYWRAVEDRKAKVQAQVANNGSSGSNTNAGSAAAAGGTVRLAGWPESGVAARRSSASRQSKRSRGGLGGSFTEPFPRN